MKFLSIVLIFALVLPVMPVQAQSSCQATVNSVVKEIKKKGVKKIKLATIKNRYSGGGGLSSPQGLDSLYITFGSPLTSRAKDVLSSKITLKSWVIRIFKECNGTGYISIGEENTDTDIEFASKSNGYLFLFQCDSLQNLNYFDSPPEYSPMQDSYCAWLRFNF